MKVIYKKLIYLKAVIGGMRERMGWGHAIVNRENRHFELIGPWPSIVLSTVA
jgi:hypothetical protein